jgi:AraC-like DNA-binding protein
VRRVLRGLLEQGTPRIEGVARALRQSPRSLQRRLSEEGTSFAALVDGARCDLALGAVARPELGLVEVASLAGFAEPSAFFRAFRRWTGCTPAEYRRREGALVVGS